MKRAFGCLGRGVLAIVLIGIIAVVAMSLLGGDDDTPEITGKLQGLVVLPAGSSWADSAEGCAGTNGLADVKNGQSITVADESGGDVSGTLAGGLTIDDGSCQFAFETDLFEADTYKFAIGSVEATCDAGTLSDTDGGAIVEIIATDDSVACRDIAD